MRISDRVAVRVLPIATMLLLLGCGGSAGAGATPGTSTAAATAAAPSLGGAPDPASAPAAASTPAEASAPVAAEPSVTAAPAGGGGTGAATDACGLITPAEFGAAVGASGVSTQLFPGELSNCIYSGSGTLAGSTSFMPRGAAAAFAIWAASSGVSKVGGVGDDAVWDPSSASLFVLKGDKLAGITAGTGAEPEADRKAWAIELGRVAAARM